ncbi:hypothetical protein RYX36_031936, partial [Vicia faba]
MSRRNRTGSKLDLKLNLSPPRVERKGMESSPSQSTSVSPSSSCVSSKNGPNSPEETLVLL